jgi:hypothetical protein
MNQGSMDIPAILSYMQIIINLLEIFRVQEMEGIVPKT